MYEIIVSLEISHTTKKLLANVMKLMFLLKLSSERVTDTG